MSLLYLHTDKSTQTGTRPDKQHMHRTNSVDAKIIPFLNEWRYERSTSMMSAFLTHTYIYMNIPVQAPVCSSSKSSLATSPLPYISCLQLSSVVTGARTSILPLCLQHQLPMPVWLVPVPSHNLQASDSKKQGRCGGYLNQHCCLQVNKSL